jgi:hypothetical protein
MRDLGRRQIAAFDPSTEDPHETISNQMFAPELLGAEGAGVGGHYRFLLLVRLGVDDEGA